MDQKKMLTALTALRFVAAAMIVLGHADPLFGSFGIANAVPLSQGVSFFFVLSGFILAYNYAEFKTREQFQNFFISRFARIWPLHSVTCIVWLGLIFNFDRQVHFPGDLGLLKLLTNFLLIQSWIPLKEWALSFNGVAWSISVEFFFYLCFPFIIILWRRYWYVLLSVSGSIVLAVIIFGNVFQLSSEVNYTGIGLLGLIYLEPLVRIFEFVIGIGLANLVRIIGPMKLTRTRWMLLELVAILAILSSLLGITTPTGIQHIFGNAAAYYFQYAGLWFFWALLIGVFSVSNGPVAELLSSRILIFLGEISFALYLVHAIVIAYLEGYPEKIHAVGFAGFFLFWIACLALATLLFFGIERPCRILILAWWAKRKNGFIAIRNRRAFRLTEYTALSLLSVAILSMAFLRPTIISAIDADAASAFLSDKSILRDSSGTFVNGVRILGIQIHKDQSGAIAAKILLMSDREMKLDTTMAIHLNDATGSIIAQPGNFVLDTSFARTAAGTHWIRTFNVNASDFDKAATLGVAMYKALPELLAVSGGKSDWNGHRLLLPLAK